MDNDENEQVGNANKILLDKSQFRIFAGLAMQRDELQKLFNELIEAEKQHIAMLVHSYGLEGEYVVQQDGKDIYLIRRDSKNS